MFGIGGFEFLLILLFAFLVFGPDKLPEIARTAGELIGRFRQAQEEMNSVVRSELLDDKNQKKKSQPSSTRRNTTAKPAPGSASSSTKESESEDTLLSDASSKVIDAVDAVTESAKEAAREQRAEQSQAKESFSERKARYERERQEANRQALKEEAKKAPEPESRPSAAELYGTKPVKPKPAVVAKAQNPSDSQEGGEE